MSTGILLINLGSPASPRVPDVRSYLNEFLMDRHVIDLPWPLRRLLVSAVILPFRPRRSAHAYASIWTPQGSPLLLNGAALAQQLSRQLDLPVISAMRYGTPSIQDGLQQLQDAGAQRVIAVPLYPQFADSTVTTSVERLRQLADPKLQIEVLPPFYGDPGYLKSLAALTRRHLPEQFDLLLMSYHGLPERHLTQADPTGSHCLQRPDCCDQPSPAHATCYRHQAYAASHALARELGLGPDQYAVSFQSRLGRLPWLQPYTDAELRELPDRGIKHLAVVCPAFVADNLETLEEIDIQGRSTFLEAGGESFHFIPCLNSEPEWVEALAAMLLPYTSPASADTSA